jgi:hypothetical protein
MVVHLPQERQYDIRQCPASSAFTLVDRDDNEASTSDGAPECEPKPSKLDCLRAAGTEEERRAQPSSSDAKGTNRYVMDAIEHLTALPQVRGCIPSHRVDPPGGGT